jgi:hypothetical protein
VAWFGAWLIGGLLGFIGFIAILNTLKVERLKLATHMLRSLSLHAVLAYDKGGVEAVRRVAEAEQKEKGFVVRAFRAAGTNIEQAFAASALEGARRTSEPPYILVYRNGILDAPSTLVANLTARTIGATIGILAFIILGLVMLVVGILLGSIVIYTTARTLRNHGKRENEVRRVLGLPETLTEAPGVGGLGALPPAPSPL